MISPRLTILGDLEGRGVGEVGEVGEGDGWGWGEYDWSVEPMRAEQSRRVADRGGG